MGYINKAKLISHIERELAHWGEEYDVWQVLKDIEDFAEDNVVGLPCKVGDTVWYIGGIHNTLIKPARVIEIVIADGGVLDLCVETDNNICYEDNFKNFLLTKEEAEAALKGDA